MIRRQTTNLVESEDRLAQIEAEQQALVKERERLVAAAEAAQEAERRRALQEVLQAVPQKLNQPKSKLEASEAALQEAVARVVELAQRRDEAQRELRLAIRDTSLHLRQAHASDEQINAALAGCGDNKQYNTVGVLTERRSSSVQLFRDALRMLVGRMSVDWHEIDKRGSLVIVVKE